MVLDQEDAHKTETADKGAETSADLEGEENPFSFTVMLRPVDAKEGAVPIGWEMEKPAWERLKAQELTVHFPMKDILQLRG